VLLFFALLAALAPLAPRFAVRDLRAGARVVVAPALARLLAARFAPRFGAAFAPRRLVLEVELELALALERRAAVRGVAERRPYSLRPRSCEAAEAPSPALSDDSMDWLVFLILGMDILPVMLCALRRDPRCARSTPASSRASREMTRRTRPAWHAGDGYTSMQNAAPTRSR
jgi:hypothetical protein